MKAKLKNVSIFLVVLMMSVGAIYNVAARKDDVYQLKYDYSIFKRGDVIVLIDSLNTIVDWMIIHQSNPVEWEVECLIKNRFASSVSVPTVNYILLDQNIRQYKLSLKLIKNPSDDMKEIVRLKLGKK